MRYGYLSPTNMDLTRRFIITNATLWTDLLTRSWILLGPMNIDHFIETSMDRKGVESEFFKFGTAENLGLDEDIFLKSDYFEQKYEDGFNLNLFSKEIKRKVKDICEKQKQIEEYDVFHENHI